MSVAEQSGHVLTAFLDGVKRFCPMPKPCVASGRRFGKWTSAHDWDADTRRVVTESQTGHKLAKLMSADKQNKCLFASAISYVFCQQSSVQGF